MSCKILRLLGLCAYVNKFEMLNCVINGAFFKVLDWLSNHGEVFIRKNTGIGRNLQKARVYQKSHEHFENVAQVSDVLICTPP